MQKLSTLLLIAGSLAFAAGCTDDEGAEPTTAAPVVEAEAPTERVKDAGMAEEGAVSNGTTIVLAESDFGAMLYDSADQAIYVFEQDATGKSNCYGECAAAWPPVLTSGTPVAGDGVEDALLGTIKRDDGSTQVTYGGRPLYFYAHEAPGEVRCHNVDLNGGFWWVVGADGEPLA